MPPTDAALPRLGARGFRVISHCQYVASDIWTGTLSSARAAPSLHPPPPHEPSAVLCHQSINLAGLTDLAIDWRLQQVQLAQHLKVRNARRVFGERLPICTKGQGASAFIALGVGSS